MATRLRRVVEDARFDKINSINTISRLNVSSFASSLLQSPPSADKVEYHHRHKFGLRRDALEQFTLLLNRHQYKSNPEEKYTEIFYNKNLMENNIWVKQVFHINTGKIHWNIKFDVERTKVENSLCYSSITSDNVPVKTTLSVYRTINGTKQKFIGPRSEIIVLDLSTFEDGDGYCSVTVDLANKENENVQLMDELQPLCLVPIRAKIVEHMFRYDQPSYKQLVEEKILPDAVFEQSILKSQELDENKVLTRIEGRSGLPKMVQINLDEDFSDDDSWE